MDLLRQRSRREALQRYAVLQMDVRGRDVDGFVKDADAAIRKNPMFNGAASYPAQYFEPKRLEPTEAATATAIAERFAQVFEPEILTFVVGPPVPGESEDPPEATAPTLFISHRLEWSGGAVARSRPPPSGRSSSS